MTMRVLLADDHALVRQALKALLDREGIQVVAEAANGQEAVSLAASMHPDIAVLDISMPMMNGLDAVVALHQCSPKTKCILLTRHDEDQYVTRALQAGIRGYVLKTQAASDLMQAIRKVYNGEVYLSPGVSGALLDAFLSKSGVSTEPLSPRERQFCSWLVKASPPKRSRTYCALAPRLWNPTEPG
jgi:DNA-binding NarL/FixJ family response regulator